MQCTRGITFFGPPCIRVYVCNMRFPGVAMHGHADAAAACAQSASDTTRLVTGSRRHERMTTVLRSLQWLPVSQRIT